MADATLVRIETKVDKINEKLHNLDTTSVKQQAILEEHIRRTELLEVTVEPLKKHVNQFNGVLRFIGLIAMLAGIAEAVHFILSK